MEPAVFAGVVAVQSPDHATHTQEYIRTVSSTPDADVVEVRCNCRPGVSVGLTLTVPRAVDPHADTAPAGDVIASFTVEKDGKVAEHPKKKGGDRGD